MEESIGLMDAEQQELLSQMVAEAVDYIHGKARGEIINQLDNAVDVSETMAAITYKTTRGLLERHKKQGMSMEMDMSLAMGLATEVLDMQVEMWERMNPETQMDTQRLREDALLRTLMAHAENVGDDPAAKEEAAMMLRGFMQDGSVDQAFGYVNQRAANDGLDIEAIIRAGNQMLTRNHAEDPQMQSRRARATAQPTPMAAGVQQGLMAQAGPEVPPGPPPENTPYMWSK
jgi:hypothetical protein